MNESIKDSIKEDTRYIEQMAPYIGSLPMNQIYRGFDANNKATPLEQFILDRSKEKVSARTINQVGAPMTLVMKLGMMEKLRRAKLKPILRVMRTVSLKPTVIGRDV